MGNPGKGSAPGKARILEVLALHRELNPVPGQPVIVAIDQRTGQLFLCASKGSSIARDQAARRRSDELLRGEAVEPLQNVDHVLAHLEDGGSVLAVGDRTADHADSLEQIRKDGRDLDLLEARDPAHVDA
jgi:hypothetical protein